MPNEPVFRPMTLADVDGVHAIEEATFAMPWSRESFVREVTENKCARYVVGELNGEIIAFAGAWLVIDEAHVTNIAVREDMRGRGYGEKITRALMQATANEGCLWMDLEVRRSNLRAQGLYRKVGFIDVGYRKRYYEDNQEDALLMVCERLPAPQEEQTDA